jgi:hypothetical protein
MDVPVYIPFTPVPCAVFTEAKEKDRRAKTEDTADQQEKIRSAARWQCKYDSSQ